MSRKYVRDIAREWVVESSPDIPFYDTINIEENPPDAYWCTLEFNHEYTDRNTYCNAQEEHGVIDIVVSGRPGEGDNAVLEYATSIAQNFMSKIDPNGKLTLLNDQAPEEFTGGDANKFYQVNVGIEYIYMFN